MGGTNSKLGIMREGVPQGAAASCTELPSPSPFPHGIKGEESGDRGRPSGKARLETSDAVGLQGVYYAQSMSKV